MAGVTSAASSASNLGIGRVSSNIGGSHAHPRMSANGVGEGEGGGGGGGAGEEVDAVAAAQAAVAAARREARSRKASRMGGWGSVCGGEGGACVCARAWGARVRARVCLCACVGACVCASVWLWGAGVLLFCGWAWGRTCACVMCACVCTARRSQPRQGCSKVRATTTTATPFTTVWTATPLSPCPPAPWQARLLIPPSMPRPHSTLPQHTRRRTHAHTCTRTCAYSPARTLPPGLNPNSNALLYDDADEARYDPGVDGAGVCV